MSARALFRRSWPAGAGERRGNVSCLLSLSFFSDELPFDATKIATFVLPAVAQKQQFISYLLHRGTKVPLSGSSYPHSPNPSTPILHLFMSGQKHKDSNAFQPSEINNEALKTERRWPRKCMQVTQSLLYSFASTTIPSLTAISTRRSKSSLRHIFTLRT